MTSLFSVSDTLATLTVTVCVLFVTGGGPGAVRGAVHIPQCSAQGWLEIREENQQSSPDITCTRLPLNDFTWQLRNHGGVTVTVTCSAEQCPSLTGDVRVTGVGSVVNDRTSELYIDSNYRGLIGNGTVKCWNTWSSASCKTNVINKYPAVLSDCEVTMTAHRTLAGTCNFRKAYSSNGTYTCTWTLKPSGRQGGSDVIIPGVIHKTARTLSGKQYYNGTCSFTKSGLPVGNYSYTVLFFPGSQHRGKEIVTVKLNDTAVLSDCEVTMTAHRTLAGTCNFYSAYSSNGTYTCTWTLTSLDRQEEPDVISGVIHKTSYTLSGKLYYNGTCSFTGFGLPVGNYSYNVRFFPGNVYQGTINVTFTEQDAWQAQNKDGDDTDGAVSGGVIAAVVITFVVIIVAVIVVVVVVMWRRRRANAERAFVDFDNPAYVSAERDVLNASPHQRQPKHPTAAYNVSSSNCSSPPTGQPTPSQATALTTANTGPDYYNLHDDEDDALHLGYSSVSFGRKGTGVSTGDNDTPPHPVAEADEGPELCDALGVGYGSGDDVRGGGDVYAQVIKNAERRGPQSPASDDNHGDDWVGDLYTQVDKSSQRRGPQSPASDDNYGDDGVGDLYTQVDKSSMRRGPPSPASDDNGDDDVYVNEGVGDAYAQVDKNVRGRRP